MKFKILTLFPEMFPGPIAHSISGKALSKKIFTIETYNIRNFTNTKSQTVDDTSYGGGPGMILKPDVLQRTLDAATKERKKRKIIYLSPGGNQLNSGTVNKLIKFEEIILICGRYEGVDERFLRFNKIEEISVGDFILSGGEIASIILIDTCVRLIPEVLGNKNSLKSESFQNHLLEYPQYTKPSNWMGLKVPEVLLNGNHSEISNWRLSESIKKTKKIRPDLFEMYIIKNKEKK
mgnify:CR=1 FL=1